jgi:hypothetical protein
MKYEVEMKRTSYVCISVDADSKEEAEQLAWYELESNESYGFGNADWEVESNVATPTGWKET